MAIVKPEPRRRPTGGVGSSLGELLWARVLLSFLLLQNCGLGARTGCCVLRARPSCELRAASCGQVGPRHLGSREQNWSPGLRCAARLLGRPSGRAERSALGRGGLQLAAFAGQGGHIQSSTRSRPSRPEQPEQTDLARASRFSDRYLQLVAQGRAAQCSVPRRYLLTVWVLPGLLSPPTSSAHLRSCLFLLSIPHHRPFLVLSCRFRLQSPALSLALEPALLLCLRDVSAADQRRCRQACPSGPVC